MSEPTVEAGLRVGAGVDAEQIRAALEKAGIAVEEVEIDVFADAPPVAVKVINELIINGETIKSGTKVTLDARTAANFERAGDVEVLT